MLTKMSQKQSIDGEEKRTDLESTQDGEHVYGGLSSTVIEQIFLGDNNRNMSAKKERDQFSITLGQILITLTSDYHATTF